MELKLFAEGVCLCLQNVAAFGNSRCFLLFAFALPRPGSPRDANPRWRLDGCRGKGEGPGAHCNVEKRVLSHPRVLCAQLGGLVPVCTPVSASE